MLYGYPSVQEARILKSILTTFSDASRALINRVKSQIFFFNTPAATQRSIERILGFSTASLPSKYLGAPLMDSTLKHSSWKQLLEKLEERLTLWTNRALNMASRIILIKVVLQSMPLYLFSILAAPKWILKEIKILQRNFLWGSFGHNIKWALVKWDKVCLPKIAGGIGLRDPEHSNKAMGAKIWWRWLAHPNTPWATLWTAKYTSNYPMEERIRMTELSTGSVFWNSVIQQRSLIQEHSFWEIKSGTTARFWEDSWQQLPRLRDILQDHQILEREMIPQDTVRKFWKTDTNQEHRQWQDATHFLINCPEQTKHYLNAELQKRQVTTLEGMDILRWGYEEKGIFTAKEAYKIIIQDRLNKDKIWEFIWRSANWLKVSTFLWLLCHNRILTWDNLRKRGFSGPSICLMCMKEEETAIHLMQTCQTGRKLWEKAVFRCQKEGRVQGDIKATLCKWEQPPFQSNLLNAFWQLIPGLLMWNIWKERNSRIFKNQSLPLVQIWTKIHQNLVETLSIREWHAEDFPITPQEKTIWDNWGIQINQMVARTKNSAMQGSEPNIWLPPPINMFQLNFDGASKGNPGKAGYGEVIRDHMGNPQCIYLGSIGWDTNNSAELEGLWRGLKLAQKNGFFPLIVEGDSQIIIRMLIKMLHGSPAHKVSKSWRMAQRLELIYNWTVQHQAISCKHIRREGNKLADLLANLGVEDKNSHFEGPISNLESEDQIVKTQEIVLSDIAQFKRTHPDAGAPFS